MPPLNTLFSCFVNFVVTDSPTSFFTPRRLWLHASRSGLVLGSLLSSTATMSSPESGSLLAVLITARAIAQSSRAKATARGQQANAIFSLTGVHLLQQQQTTKGLANAWHSNRISCHDLIFLATSNRINKVYRDQFVKRHDLTSQADRAIYAGSKLASINRPAHVLVCRTCRWDGCQLNVQTCPHIVFAISARATGPAHQQNHADFNVVSNLFIQPQPTNASER